MTETNIPDFWRWQGDVPTVDPADLKAVCGRMRDMKARAGQSTAISSSAYQGVCIPDADTMAVWYRASMLGLLEMLPQMSPQMFPESPLTPWTHEGELDDAVFQVALRLTDLDFSGKIIRVRQSIDAATRLPQAVKSQASSADVPMPSQLGARLRKHLQTHVGKTDLLFVNRRGRPFSANKLREKVLHPLLVKLGIPRGGFHSMRHGATSALLADGATPAVVQKQLRHSDPRITLGIYGHVIGNQQRDAVENRSARIEQFAVN